MAIWYKKVYLGQFNRLKLENHPKVLRLLNVVQNPLADHPYEARVYFVVDLGDQVSNQTIEIQSLPTGESDIEEAQGQFLGTVITPAGNLSYVWHHFGRVKQ
jgi:hypothetical protein